tara:strand:+ start:3637 stop:4950 length:1314 start_codon:yes stop_codon:yes gene_type:complete
MRLVLLILCLLLCSEYSYSKDNFNAEEFSLQNGLKVIVVENKRAPVVSQMIWYKFGSSAEEIGKSGLAHFMEHLMFKGTKKFPKNYYSNFLSKIGGTENAFTSYDYTAYYQIFPSDKTEKIIEMEADRMKNLSLTKKMVEIEKKVILEERFQRIESDPSSLLDESMRSILYPNSYYGRPIIGWKSEIENLDYEDVISFYEKHYSPNNAILILTGDINLKEAKRIVRKYYGDYKKLPNENNFIVKDPDIRTFVISEHTNKDVRQPIWKKIYRVNSYTESINEGIALDIGLRIILGGSTSILYDSLVNEKKIFSMVGGFYQGLAKNGGYAYLYAIPVNDLDTNKINDILIKEIELAIEKKITLEMLKVEKKKYLYSSIYRMDGILKPAEIIGEALSIGLSIEDIKNWNKKVEKLNIEDIKTALKAFLSNKNFVIGGLKN